MSLGKCEIYTNGSGQMTKMADMPTYGKTLQTLHLWNQKVNDLGLYE